MWSLDIARDEFKVRFPSIRHPAHGAELFSPSSIISENSTDAGFNKISIGTKTYPAIDFIIFGYFPMSDSFIAVKRENPAKGQVIYMGRSGAWLIAFEDSGEFLRFLFEQDAPAT